MYPPNLISPGALNSGALPQAPQFPGIRREPIANPIGPAPVRPVGLPMPQPVGPAPYQPIQGYPQPPTFGQNPPRPVMPQNLVPYSNLMRRY